METTPLSLTLSLPPPPSLAPSLPSPAARTPGSLSEPNRADLTSLLVLDDLAVGVVRQGPNGSVRFRSALLCVRVVRERV